MTHRDPVSVIQSAATMMTYAARMAYRTIDPGWYIDYWTDRIERLLTAAVRDVHLIPDTISASMCSFDDFMADDQRNDSVGSLLLPDILWTLRAHSPD